MYMVRADFRFMDLYSLPLAQLPQYLSDCLPFLSKEYFSPVLRCKHNVIFAIPFRMC